MLVTANMLISAALVANVLLSSAALIFRAPADASILPCWNKVSHSGAHSVAFINPDSGLGHVAEAQMSNRGATDTPCAEHTNDVPGSAMQHIIPCLMWQNLGTQHDRREVPLHGERRAPAATAKLLTFLRGCTTRAVALGMAPINAAREVIGSVFVSVCFVFKCIRTGLLIAPFLAMLLSYLLDPTPHGQLSKSSTTYSFGPKALPEDTLCRSSHCKGCDDIVCDDFVTTRSAPTSDELQTIPSWPLLQRGRDIVPTECCMHKGPGTYHLI